MKKDNISIIGGCGHVGLPLALKFAEKNFTTYAIDINSDAINRLNHGKLPYKETGGQKLLKKVLKKKKKLFLPMIMKK